jgi:hypothetical protein
MTVTWRSLGGYCRERDWSKPRALSELRNGLRCRVVFEDGRVRELQTDDWRDPNVRNSLDIQASTVRLYGMISDDGVVGFHFDTVGVEVLPPGGKEKRRRRPRTQQRPKRPSDASVERCFRAIMKDRPDDPPDETWLLAEMKQRLSAPPGRARVRNLWRKIAPQWKRPVGHPPA